MEEKKPISTEKRTDLSKVKDTEKRTATNMTHPTFQPGPHPAPKPTIDEKPKDK